MRDDHVEGFVIKFTRWDRVKQYRVWTARLLNVGPVYVDLVAAGTFEAAKAVVRLFGGDTKETAWEEHGRDGDEMYVYRMKETP